MAFQSFSVCPGMTWIPGAGWASPIQDSTAVDEPNAVDQRRLGTRILRNHTRRRARTIEGRFIGDNPETLENEAFEPDAAEDEREN